MAGTCIATVKFVGVTSLGLLTSSLVYESIKLIPGLINGLKLKVSTLTNDGANAIKSTLQATRIANLTFGSLASGLFALAYKCSPQSEKHPYLIYSALGAPIAIITIAYNGYKYEQSLANRTNSIKERKTEPLSPIASESNADDSSSQLAKSYIHVSDEEESSSLSTPMPSSPGSPKLEANASVEEDAEDTLVKKQIIHELSNIRSSYVYGSFISGTAFLLSIVGLFGDYLFL